MFLLPEEKISEIYFSYIIFETLAYIMVLSMCGTLLSAILVNSVYVNCCKFLH